MTRGSAQVPSPEGPFSRVAVAAALEGGEFELFYQPTIDLRSNGFAGVEALVRWRREGELLSPEAFLEGLRLSGADVDLGHWALTTACFAGAHWHARGYRFLVSVNIAPAHLAEPDFGAQVEAALRRTRFEPRHLVLELASESILQDRAPAALAALVRLGVVLGVDDAALDSPLNELAARGVTLVKLTRGAVSSLSGRPDAADELAALVEAARDRGIRLVAAGVEDAGQRLLLQSGSIPLGQGYLFSHPHDADMIDRLLEDYALFSGDPL